MQMSPLMLMAIPCPACGSKEDSHAYGCPRVVAETLASRRMHVECPICRARDVDRNDGDWMECRACHTQFVLAGGCGGREDLKVVWLDLPDAQGGIQQFLVLPEKGTGRFSIDKAHEKACEELRLAIERRSAEQGIG